LRQVAERRRWEVVEVYSDAGVSGAKDRKQRRGLDRMLSDAGRGKFGVVMDLLGTIQHLEACGVDLYLYQQNIDTTTPMGKLIFQNTGAFAEFEHSMIRQRINAGLQRARKAGKVLGRAGIAPAIGAAIRRSLEKGRGIRETARRWASAMGRLQDQGGARRRQLREPVSPAAPGLRSPLVIVAQAIRVGSRSNH
jgi:DNA invertase Pin-like site-specific DNA recombinase